MDVLLDKFEEREAIRPRMADFEALVAQHEAKDQVAAHAAEEVYVR